MYIIVTTTFEKMREAKRIAEMLVEDKLAACIQIVGPIDSVYFWKGDVEISEEYICVIKTKEDLYERLEKKIKENHPYENPEIVATQVRAGSQEYLGWIDEVTR